MGSNPLEIGDRDHDTVTSLMVGVLAKILKVRPEEIRLQSSLTRDLRADSLDLAELAAELEDVFQVKVKEAEVHTIATVAEAIDYVRRLRANH